MTGTFEYENGDKRAVPDFNVFFRYFATYPYYSDAVWYLTQMRRWGQIAEQPRRTPGTKRPPSSVYQPDIYLEAARQLVAEGKAKQDDFPWTSDGFRARPATSSMGSIFDAHKPERVHRKLEDRAQARRAAECERPRDREVGARRWPH